MYICRHLLSINNCCCHSPFADIGHWLQLLNVVFTISNRCKCNVTLLLFCILFSVYICRHLLSINNCCCQQLLQLLIVVCGGFPFAVNVAQHCCNFAVFFDAHLPTFAIKLQLLFPTIAAVVNCWLLSFVRCWLLSSPIGSWCSWGSCLFSGFVFVFLLCLSFLCLFCFSFCFVFLFFCFLGFPGAPNSRKNVCNLCVLCTPVSKKQNPTLQSLHLLHACQQKHRPKRKVSVLCIIALFTLCLGCRTVFRTLILFE